MENNVNKIVSIAYAGYITIVKEVLAVTLKLHRRRMKTMRKMLLKNISRRFSQNLKIHNGNVHLAIKQLITNVPKKMREKNKEKPNQHWWNAVMKAQVFSVELIENFRMDRDSFNYICEKLSIELSQNSCNILEPITVEMKVGISLCKLSSYADYTAIANRFGVQKSTVKKCLHLFCTAVVKVFSKEEIKIPLGQEAREIINKFEEISGLPQILGAIGSTHIPVIPPPESSDDYINRNGWSSIVLQAVVDYNHRFLNITSKPGSTDDATVLEDSLLNRDIEHLELPTEIIAGKEMGPFIVGDHAYPLLPWLMTPYLNVRTPEERSFNIQINNTRIVVDNAFKRLKSRWRILQKRIEISVDFVPNIVATCCMLHNILEKRNAPYNNEWETNQNGNVQPTIIIQESNLLSDENRDQFKDRMTKFPTS